MKKLGIGLQVFMCAVLSFLGFVNYGVWIWMAGKMGLKKIETGWYGTVWLNGYAYGISRRL